MCCAAPSDVSARTPHLALLTQRLSSPTRGEELEGGARGCGGGFAGVGDEAVDAEVVGAFAVVEGRAVEARDVAAGGFEDGVAGGGVPFVDVAEAGIEVGCAFGDAAEFDRGAGVGCCAAQRCDEGGGLAVAAGEIAGDDAPL